MVYGVICRMSTNVTITTGDEPTLSEALKSTAEEEDLWLSAIDVDFQSLESKEDWYPDESPQSQPLPTHPVLKIKRNSGGNVERFRAHIVAGGNHQVYGENYKETHSPVVSFSLVRIFLYLTLCLGMSIFQVDMKKAFLNVDLSESVWVMSPRGIPGVRSRCYRLKKDMYELKQAHLAWHSKLCGDLNRLGFNELSRAPCLFSRKIGGGKNKFFLVYVEDLLILANTNSARDAIVEHMKSWYSLRVSEKVDLFLGVHLKWSLSRSGQMTSLKLCQAFYAESIYEDLVCKTQSPRTRPWLSHCSNNMIPRKTSQSSSLNSTNR